MDQKQEAARKRLRRELCRLSGEGVRICYPDDRDIAPERMADVIVRDAEATYMRDLTYDEEGKVIEVCFRRVRETRVLTGRKEQKRKPVFKTIQNNKKE